MSHVDFKDILTSRKQSSNCTSKLVASAIGETPTGGADSWFVWKESVSKPRLAAVKKFDWTGWEGKIPATLMFVVSEGRILLIEKKRGHGQGKINGPGGKIDPGESALECAVRETREELLINVKNPKKVAELWFQMSDYPSLLCHVYLAREFDGEPTETDEAVPLWVPLNEIPYQRMWEDDRHWLPRILGGETLIGKFVFEGERMLSKEISSAKWQED